MENIAFYSEKLYQAYLLGEVPFDKSTRAILAEFSKIIIYEEENFFLTRKDMVDIIQNGRLKNSITPLFLSFEYKSLLPVLSYDLISNYTYLCDRAEKYGNPNKISFDFSNLLFLKINEDSFNDSFRTHGADFLKSFFSKAVYLAVIFQHEKNYQTQLLTNLTKFKVKKNPELVKIFSDLQPQLALLNIAPIHCIPEKLVELVNYEAPIFSETWTQMNELLKGVVANFGPSESSELRWDKDNSTLHIPEDNGEYAYRLTPAQYYAFERIYEIRNQMVNKLKSSDIRDGKLELSNLFKKDDALFLKCRYLEVEGKYWSCRKSPQKIDRTDLERIKSKT